MLSEKVKDIKAYQEEMDKRLQVVESGKSIEPQISLNDTLIPFISRIDHVEKNLNSAPNPRPDTKVFSKLKKLSRLVENQENKSRRPNIVIKRLSMTKPAEEIATFLKTTFSILCDGCKLIA